MKVLQDRLIVDPFYDAQMIGSLYLPDSGKNSESQQGIVTACGQDSGVHPGDHVLYHPYRGDPFVINGRESLALRRKDLVGTITRHGDTYDLHPMPDHVMVLPDWDRKYQQPSSGLVFMPDTALEHNEPVQYGMVLEMGWEVEQMPGRDFTLEDVVLIAPEKGSEVGWGLDRKVYYFLRPSHILARVDNAPNT